MIKNYLQKILNKKTSNKNIHKKNTQIFDLQYIPTTNHTITKRATVESYRYNVIVYRCVNLIANSASHVPWYVKKKND